MNDKLNGGSGDEEEDSDDDLQNFMRAIFSAPGAIDPRLASGDPEAINQLMAQMQALMAGIGNSESTGIDAPGALRQARQELGDVAVSATDRDRLAKATNIAALWLDPATALGSFSASPKSISRSEWLESTMPVWQELAAPVSASIADTLAQAMKEQAPEEFAGMLGNAERVLRGVGRAMFSMQLGQVVGQLGREVVSGGDIALPLFPPGEAVLLPQNIDAFSEGLEVDRGEVDTYLAVRELAHARLMKHARWLPLQVLSSVRTFAEGIDIDFDRLQGLAENFDPEHAQELRQVVASGELIKPRSEPQTRALERLETTLALIEGWIDVVTEDATKLLPTAGAIAETIRRRRAIGGPAESALATLVGLELRPRRMREAANLWRKLGDELGQDARDALWGHPDLVPSPADIDDPSALIAKLRGETVATTESSEEFDRDLGALLRGEIPSVDAEPGTADPSDGDGPDAPTEPGGPGKRPGDEPRG